MSLVDLRAFAFPVSALLSPLDADDADALSLSDIGQPLNPAEAADTQAILREVANLLARTPGALGSMRWRLGIVVDCLIAVADEIDGNSDLEDGADQEAVCEDEGAQCDDEGAPDDNGIADDDGRSEQCGHQDQHGAWVLG